MEVVLGVAMAPETVRMVLVEGEGAGGVTVDQDGFGVAAAATAAGVADRLVAAILGTRESAAAGGYRLRSTGVTWTDQVEAGPLRDALAARKVENVMLVSAFVAAASLAQSVGSATNCARTALLFVEPTVATLAVVDTADGAIADAHRQVLPRNDDAALVRLAAMVSKADSMKARPDGVFLVGSGVDIPAIKPTLEAATRLSVTTPEEPEMALARGAALASANAQLGAPPTVAMPSRDLTAAGRELAYSADLDDEIGPAIGGYRELTTDRRGRRSHKSVLAAGGAMAIFVGGVAALAVALALGIRPHVEQRPGISQNVVAPAAPVPPPAPPVPKSAAPSSNPPQQGPPLNPGGDLHGGGGWLRRQLDRYGIPVP